MSLTNTEALSLYQTIGKFQTKEDLPTKFSWALMRTKKRLKVLIDSMDEIRQPPARMQEYETKRIALCEAASEKEEDGKPKVENNNFVIETEAREQLNKDIAALRDGDFKEMFDEQEKKSKDIEDLMKEECDIELFKVAPEFLPETMSPADLEILEVMIED
jgi:hypothetical protein